MAVNPLSNKYHNNEIPAETKLSGNGYIAARLRTDLGKTRLDKLATATPVNCGHINRICTTCAHEWSQDYILIYSRTAAGRAMAAQLGIEL